MKKALGMLGIATACAACCAPLVLPLWSGLGLVGAGAVGGAAWFNVPADAIICGGVVLALAAAAVAWGVGRRTARVDSACGCETACSTEASRSVPTPR